MSENKKELSFEEALKKLEEITSALESGRAELDKSLELFEEGIRLVKYCQAKLDGAEQKVKILTESQNGELDEKDFADNK